MTKKKIINKIKRKGIWQTGENIYNTNDRKGLISLIYNKLLQISEKDINHSIGKKWESWVVTSVKVLYREWERHSTLHSLLHWNSTTYWPYSLLPPSLFSFNFQLHVPQAKSRIYSPDYFLFLFSSLLTEKVAAPSLTHSTGPTAPHRAWGGCEHKGGLFWGTVFCCVLFCVFRQQL